MSYTKKINLTVNAIIAAYQQQQLNIVTGRNNIYKAVWKAVNKLQQFRKNEKNLEEKWSEEFFRFLNQEIKFKFQTSAVKSQHKSRTCTIY